MTPQVAHPRAVAVVQTLLFVVGALVAGVVVAATVGVLVLVGVLGSVAALLTSEPVLWPVLGLVGLTLLVASAVLGILAVSVRRARRWVREWDAAPTPVETAKRRYVHGHLDERGLERALEGALDGSNDPSHGPTTYSRWSERELEP
jgi:hypothetical protein